MRAWGARVWNRIRRARMEHELDEDVRTHLAIAADEYARAGLDPEAARAAARRSFGGVARMKDAHRDERQIPVLDTLLREARMAVRSLRRTPGWTSLAVLTLALGIGATTAVFSLVDGVLFRPLPFADPDRLVSVWEDVPASGRPRVEVSPLNYADWSRQVDAFEDLAAYGNSTFNLTGEGTPERLVGAYVTPNLLSLLGVEVVAGRNLAVPDGSPGEAPVAVLSYGLWQRRFGGDRSALGRTVRLNDQSHTIVGVVPRGFAFPNPDVDVWVPSDYRAGAWQTRDLRVLYVVGRLRTDVTLERANAELEAVAARLAETHWENKGAGAFLVPLHQDLVRTVRPSFLLLLGAALLVLLVACANVANLLITRGAGREREFAIRTALGAGRVHVLRQLLAEGLLLSASGSAVGAVLAAAMLGAVERLIPASLAGLVTIAVDLRVLTVAVAASLSTGVAFGLFPLARIDRRRLTASLGSRSAAGAGARRWLQASLVSAEVALGLVVVSSTALMVRTILNLEAADIGFSAAQVLTARVELTTARYPTPERRVQFHGEALDRIRSLPGVLSAGFGTFLPYTDLAGSGVIGVGSFRIEERPDLEVRGNRAILRTVTPGYLESLRVLVLAGRAFNDSDTQDTMPVALVDERIAALFSGDPVGQRIGLPTPDGDRWLTVVGVVGRIRSEGVDEPEGSGTLYRPHTQMGPADLFFSPHGLAVRTAGDPEALAAAVRREIWAIDADQTISDMRTLEAIVGGQIADRKVQTALLTSFSGLSLVLAALGVYGLLSFVVASRTNEIGVRTAMGAQARDVVALVFRDSLAWMACGIAGGLALTLVVSRSLTSLLYGVEPLDWLSLTVAVMLLGGTGVLASLVPAWRAARVDPMKALRYE